MKAITICQPHAWAVIYGPKRIENRRWWCDYRGPLAIHAGTSREWMDDYELYPGQPPDREIVFGAIIGVVVMTGCKSIAHASVASDPYAEGPYCHLYTDPIPLRTPTPIRGQLGLWDLPPDVETAIKAQVEMISGKAVER